MACTGGFSTGIPGDAGENGHATEGEWRLSDRGSPSRSSAMDFTGRRDPEMVFCIAVRLSPKTKDVIGAAGGPQEMLWIEAQNPVPREGRAFSPQQVPASSRKESKNGRVRWYRLPGRTYVSE